MTGLRVHVALLALIAVVWAAPVRAGDRLALVIGVDRYVNLPETAQLQKAVNDANAVGDALAELGFSVSRAENVSRGAMSRALGTLEQRINVGDTVFVFFAGHGIDIDGTNYLLPNDVPSPVDATGRRLPVRAFRDASFNAAELLSSLQARGAATVIAVFDACREPFNDEGKRSLGLSRGGLAKMTPASGMFIMFSAGAKQLALDRLSRDDPNPNSVFTRTLVPLLKQPGLSLVRLAKQVQPRVAELASTVSHVQTPAYYDQILGDFFLRPAAVGAAPSPGARPPTVQRDPCAGFGDNWKTAETIGTREAFQLLIDRFPGCSFVESARRRIAALEQAVTPAAAPPDDGRPDTDEAAVCQGAGSLWDVNGSLVILKASGADPERRFYYCRPGRSARSTGASPGSLLFTGRRSGDRYRGTAYLFAGRCGSFSYPVSGYVTNGDQTVVVRGRQPVIDRSNCRVVRYSVSQLEFNYQRRN